MLAELAALHGPRRRAGGRHHDGDPRSAPPAPAHAANGTLRPACSPSSSSPASRATSAWRSAACARPSAGLGLWRRRLERLRTAVGEATMNAMEHGNGYRDDRRSRSASYAARPAAGPDHRPRRRQSARRAEVPDLEAKLAGLQRPRGWGLFLIEKMVDEARVIRRRAAAHGRARRCAWKEAAMATRELEVAVRRRDGVAVIDLHGDVDAPGRGRARRRLRAGGASAAPDAVVARTSPTRTTSTARASR